MSTVVSSNTSTYPSEAEWDEDAVNALNIAALTLDVPIANKPPPKKKAREIFRFMDLPHDLRVKIYEYHFAPIGHVVDLEHGNYFTIHKRLSLFRVCRQIYHEASHVFYSTKTFRIFPIDGRFSRAKKGLLARMKPRARAHLTSLELRLGPGWSKPYRSWVVDPLVGLADCVNVHRLCVYIEIDPSDNIFNGWRKSNGFYEQFCQNLLDEILKAVPSVDKVQFDARISVKKAGNMTSCLLETARANDRAICWGPERGWTDADDDEEEVQDAALVTGYIAPRPAGWGLGPSTAAVSIAQPVAA